MPRKGKTKSLNIRFTEPEYLFIEYLSKTLGVSKGEAVRRTLFAYQYLMETPLHKLVRPLPDLLKEDLPDLTKKEKTPTDAPPLPPDVAR